MDTSILTGLYQRIHFPAEAAHPTLVDFLQAHQAEAPTSIRINPLKSTTVPTSEQVPWCEYGRYLERRPVFTLDPLLHCGAYYVQEASSMFTGYVFEQLFPQAKNLRVLDLCAAPGGKSTHISSLLTNDSLLISNEVIQPRAGVLAENISKFGRMNNWVTNLDPAALGRLNHYFDCIIIDAPCTGSGLWRKDKEAMKEWSENNVQLCHERQQRIIADILPSLKEGGILIYSTCSYSIEENEAINDWVLHHYEMENVRINLEKEWEIIESLSPVARSFGYRLAPWNLKGEGFYLSAFRNTRSGIQEMRKQARPSNKKADKSILSLSKWLNTTASFISRNDEVYAIPATLEPDYYLLADNKIHLKKTGTALGKVIRGELIPDHELALSIHLDTQYPVYELDESDAIRFLRKEDISNKDNLKGWYLITYKGAALGWAKWLSGRMNNYYPKNWRIRMQD